MATVEQLKQRVNGDHRHEDTLTECLAVAEVLVAEYVGTAVIPVIILDEAVLRTAAELFDATEGPVSSQAGQFDTAGPALRITRDPMQSAYGILRRWVLPF